jgi:hypothetical protein
MNNDEISQYIERAWDDLRQWAKDNRVSLEKPSGDGMPCCSNIGPVIKEHNCLAETSYFLVGGTVRNKEAKVVQVTLRLTLNSDFDEHFRSIHRGIDEGVPIFVGAFLQNSSTQ